MSVPCYGVDGLVSELQKMPILEGVFFNVEVMVEVVSKAAVPLEFVHAGS